MTGIERRGVPGCEYKTAACWQELSFTSIYYDMKEDSSYSTVHQALRLTSWRKYTIYGDGRRTRTTFIHLPTTPSQPSTLHPLFRPGSHRLRNPPWNADIGEFPWSTSLFEPHRHPFANISIPDICSPSPKSRILYNTSSCLPTTKLSAIYYLLRCSVSNLIWNQTCMDTGSIVRLGKPLYSSHLMTTMTL